VVVVEEWPTPEQLDGRPGTLLGLYEGVPLTARGPVSYAGVAPDRITVFSGSICRLAHDEDELARSVRTTVLHEVGHYFGMSDERLHELGWA
jgi:predicted Zn-dependent protease with MMP-like domain